MAHKKSENKYIQQRKKLIREERSLVYERDKINKQLREIRKSIYSWDNWLVNKDE